MQFVLYLMRHESSYMCKIHKNERTYCERELFARMFYRFALCDDDDDDDEQTNVLLYFTFSIIIIIIFVIFLLLFYYYLLLC